MTSLAFGRVATHHACSRANVAQCVLQPKCTTIPKLLHSVLSAADDDRKSGAGHGKGDIVCVTVQHLNTTFARVRPYVHSPVVPECKEVGLVRIWIEFDMVELAFFRVLRECSWQLRNPDSIT